MVSTKVALLGIVQLYVIALSKLVIENSSKAASVQIGLSPPEIDAPELIKSLATINSFVNITVRGLQLKL